MRSATTVLVATLVATLLAWVGPANVSIAASAPSPVGPSSFPVPEHDPFYRLPRGLGGHAPGDVLDSRRVDVRSFELPLPAKAWQVNYRTEDRIGRPSATVTTILVPHSSWTGAGRRPVVSYQTAEDGVAGRCAPSYALRAGAQGGFTGSYSETSLIASLLTKGWAVAVPDYEGPESQFLVAGVQAKGVLDGVRAVQRFKPARLRRSPVALWGYSGGSLASVTAAQLQSTYAPELSFEGIALGGLLGSVRATIDAFSGSIGGGAIPMGINGFLRSYPRLDLLQYLTPSGRAKVAAAAADCLFDAAARYPLLRLSDIEGTPDALKTPPVARMLRRNSPRYLPGAPTAPVYHYHAILDEFAPIGPARATLRNFCREGTPVQSDEKLLGEHLTEIVAGAPGAVAFLESRFAGDNVVDSCGELTS